MLALFTLTVFVGSFLLFMVQPLVARQLLPVLGGTPAVWITCMMFFQAALLGGYVYAHESTRRLGMKRQPLLHLAVLAAPLLLLPPGVDAGWSPPVEGTPIWWLLGALAMMVGAPFFALSAGAPLLQRWFSATDHRRARDPYFLYAASNAGSMGALLAYPIVIEPLLTLAQQSAWWSAGYGVLVLLCVACAIATVRRGAAPESAGSRAADGEGHQPLLALKQFRVWRWILLAFIPSAWMLAVTSYITADLASVPLFWVIPLALYLLSFILVFARRPWVPHRVMKRLFAPSALILVLLLATESAQPVGLVMTMHLMAFFIACMACHGELASDRPPPSHLTTFYVMLSIGGALGGVFNAIVAPLLFAGIYEYPLVVVLGVAAVGSALPQPPRVLARTRWKSAARDVLIGLIVAAAVWGLIVSADAADLPRGPARSWLIVGLPVMACYLFANRPLRFGLSLGAVMAVATFDVASHGAAVEYERSFFGVHTVHRTTLLLDEDEGGGLRPFNELYHGTTLHGRQEIDPETKLPIEPRRPRSYYSVAGPAGQVFRAMAALRPEARIGVVGLGTGGTAAHVEAGQHLTFYEIDPAVRRLAENERYFTYLREARQRGAVVDIVMGDARRTLAREPREHFDLLVIDAFSSDAIPIHLITREAIELYLTRLKPGGVLLLHISSRYFNLEPVVERAARSLGIACLTREDLVDQMTGEHLPARLSSTWMALAGKPEDLAFLRSRTYGMPWSRSRSEPGRIWTDDYSNVLGALGW